MIFFPSKISLGVRIALVSIVRRRQIGMAYYLQNPGKDKEVELTRVC
jgi:hypothetical protein